MNKALQENINRWCMDFMRDVNDDINESHGWLSIKRLRSCRAYVYETEKFFILQSYNTLGVAFIRKDNKQCYDVLRYVYGYTATSAQHIAKFIHDYGDSRLVKYTYR